MLQATNNNQTLTYSHSKNIVEIIITLIITSYYYKIKCDHYIHDYFRYLTW